MPFSGPEPFADRAATTTRGHTWQWPAAIQPAIVTAMDWTIPRQRRPVRSLHAYWALDVETAPGFRYRVPSASPAWQIRRERTLHLYAPNTLYWEDDSRVATPSLRSQFILFRLEEPGMLAGPFGSTRDYAIIQDPEGELAARVERVIDAGHHLGQAGAAKAQALLWQILEWMQALRPVAERVFGGAASGEEDPGESAHVRAVHAFFRSRLPHPITLADLAKHLNLSSSTISHRYRRETGRPPMARLIQMRLDLAKGMLLKGHRLQQIAEQTGFHDAFHFSKMFKRHTGLSPRAFRQRHQAMSRAGSPA